MTKDFYIYEQNELVAKAESLTLSVSTKHKKFKLEDIDILPNFHLINDSTNAYDIRFKGDNASGMECEYSVVQCIFTGRSPVSEDWSHLEYIEGTFSDLMGALEYPDKSLDVRAIDLSSVIQPPQN